MTPPPANCVLVEPADAATVREIGLRLCGRRVTALADLPPEPWSLGPLGLVASCEPADEPTLAAAIEAALRGVDLVVSCGEPLPARWLDSLSRAASLIDWRQAPHAGLAPLDVALLARLRHGETVAHAAVACGTSERTASRRLLAVRATLGARSNAEALITLDEAVRVWTQRR